MKSISPSRRVSGFSLVELAIVVVLMGTLMTFGIKLATSFQEKGNFSATRERQATIKETLRSYLARNGRLPCPASPTASPITGIEDPSPATGSCTFNPGIVPFVTLGLSRDTVLDGWDRYIGYEVTNASFGGACTNNWTNVSLFPAVGGVRTFHDGQIGCITITDNFQGDADTTNDITRSNVVAVLFSSGPNGLGGLTAKETIIAFDEADTTNSREQNNIRTHTLKVAHAFQMEPTSVNGFDDLVVEISADDLLVPLKREGSIISLNQTLRNYIDANYAVDTATCTLTYPATIAPTPASPGANVASVTLSATSGSTTESRIIGATSAGCPAGLNY